jgi:RNA polymerase sigma-70 factor (ECF subfamily)
MTMHMAERIEAPDAEQPVIEAIRSGDRYAFDELVRRHNGWVRGAVFGVMGDRDGLDDVVQQVWTGFWQRAGELRDVNRWRPWLYRLARNAALDAGRKITRRKRIGDASREPVDAPTTEIRAAVEPDTNVEYSERRGVVFDAIRALPTLYREPFVLRHLNEWSYQQIADVMDMPVDSVETRLVRARRLLREMLKDKV